MKFNRTLLVTTSCLTLFVSGNMTSLAASPNDDKAKTEQKDKGKNKNKDKDKKDDKKSAATEEAQQTTVDENSILGRMALTVKAYFLAKSPQEKLEYILNPKETEPLMRDYYFRKGMIPGNLVQMSTPQAFAVQGVSFWKTTATLQDGRQSLVFIRMEDDKTPKIDWGSEVRYSSMGWDEWLKKGNTEPVEFRVSTQLDSHYSKQFEDRSKYLCIKVSSPDSVNTILAYLNLQDPDQREFAEKLAKGGQQDCILSLKTVPSDGEFKLATVEKIISPSWILMAQNTTVQK